MRKAALISDPHLDALANAAALLDWPLPRERDASVHMGQIRVRGAAPDRLWWEVATADGWVPLT
jgi:hypothetical protein